MNHRGIALLPALLFLSACLSSPSQSEHRPLDRNQRIDTSRIAMDGAIVLGPGNAKRHIYLFTDPDCIHCRRFHSVMRQTLSARKDVAFVVILTPLPMHKEAFGKARAILCSRSPDLLDDAYEGKEVSPPACIADTLDRNIALFLALNLRATPTLVRDDGMVRVGALSLESLNHWIDGLD